jgi:hypothetical protein
MLSFIKNIKNAFELDDTTLTKMHADLMIRTFEEIKREENKKKILEDNGYIIYNWRAYKIN